MGDRGDYVTVGSAWQDADPREQGHRYLEVLEVEHGFARCRVTRTDGKPHRSTVTVRLDRFRSNGRGYRPVAAMPDSCSCSLHGDRTEPNT